MVNGEVPQIDWPVVSIGKHRLVVKWGFRCQWLCSKRNIDVSIFGQSNDVRRLDTVVEAFAVAVGDNFRTMGLQIPTGDYWVAEIEALGPTAYLGKLREISDALYAAIQKARAAETPVQLPTDPARTNEQTLN